MRAHPVKHTVKKHRRSGHAVHSYERGKGKRAKVNRVSFLKKEESHAVEGFKVTVKYASGQDTFSTNAANVGGAIDVGTSKSTDVIKELVMEVKN